MKILVKKKEQVNTNTGNPTVLRFEKQRVLKSRYICMYDTEQKFIDVVVSTNAFQKHIPSTLLSRWINANFKEELLSLKNRCNTVQYLKDGVNKGWYFTNKENALYGLHKIKVRENGVTTRIIEIDDSIGMKNVKNILKELDITVDCKYNIESGNMIEIKLFKGV